MLNQSERISSMPQTGCHWSGEAFVSAVSLIRAKYLMTGLFSDFEDDRNGAAVVNEYLRDHVKRLLIHIRKLHLQRSACGSDNTEA
jgi:hypothetical protein